MKQIFKSRGVKVASLVAGMAVAFLGIAPVASVSAAPTGCSSWKVTSTKGAARCTGGTGWVRVKVVCWSGGVSYTDYGPWVGIGNTSYQVCPSSTWMDVYYQLA